MALRNHRKEVWLLTISIFLFSLIVGLLGTVLPLYLKQQNFTISEIGFLFSAASILFAMGNFFLGAASDYFGRKRFIMLAIAGMVVSSLLIAFVPSAPLVIAGALVVAGRLLSALSGGLFFTFTNIRMADLGKAQRGMMYGLYMLGSGAGIGAGMIFFSFLLKFLPFNYLFYIGAVIAFVSLIFFSYTKEFVAKQEKLTFKGLFSLKLSKPVKIYLALIFMMLFAFAIVDFFIVPIYMLDVLKLSDSAIVLILGAATLLYGILSGFLGKYADIKNEFHISYFAFLAVVVTSLFLGALPTIVGFTVFWILDYLAWSFNDPARFKIAADLAGKERGKLLGLFGLVVAIAQAIGFAVAGKLVGLVGYSQMFYLRGALLFICFLLMFWIHTSLKHE